MTNSILKILCFVTLGLLTLTAVAQEETGIPQMYICMRNGEKLIFELNEKPIVCFNEDVLKIYSADFLAEIETKEYSDVAKIYFSDNIATDIKDVNLKQSLRFVDGHTVKIGGIESYPNIGIYTVDGKKIDAEVKYFSNSITIDLQYLPGGFYVIKVNRQSYKVRKR